MTKVHALTDVIGSPYYVLMLTPGDVSDVNAAPALLKVTGRMGYLLINKGYDADRLRRSLRDAEMISIMIILAEASLRWLVSDNNDSRTKP